MIDNYIFDLDGTLINSAEEVLRCLKLSFDRAGCFVAESKFTSDLIGPPIKKIIMNIAPEIKDEDLLECIVKNFRDIYDNDKEDISYLYVGIRELLQTLKQKNKKLFIATFKPQKPTMRIIEQFNLKYFDDVYCIDKFDKPMTKGEMITDIINKYNLKKEETVMIGDAQSDMLAAKEAGVKGIGVLWGYDADKTKLKKHADIVINSIEEIAIKEVCNA